MSGGPICLFVVFGRIGPIFTFGGIMSISALLNNRENERTDARERADVLGSELCQALYEYVTRRFKGWEEGNFIVVGGHGIILSFYFCTSDGDCTGCPSDAITLDCDVDRDAYVLYLSDIDEIDWVKKDM